MNTSGSTKAVDLKPCPFCDAGETISEPDSKVWAGMEWRILSWRIRHWCSDKTHGSLLTVKGKDQQEAEERWNRRLAPEPAECKDCDKLMTERDDATEQADKLAECIEGLLGIEIGEHSSGNAPWQNAIDAAEYELDKRKRNAETKEAIRPRFCQCGIIAPPSGVKCARCEFEQPANGGGK